MKRIAVLTSGGDAPGMNACIRAIVRTAKYHKINVTGIYFGYEGLIHDNCCEMEESTVANIIHKGGTILKSSRSALFRIPEGMEMAYQTLKKREIDAVIAIGGDGTFAGALEFNSLYNIPFIGCPGTIDNDLIGTDFTIGYDTAINTVIEAVDKIRDTAESHNRLFIVEVMGKDAGLIAMRAGIGAGAEGILIPESKNDLDKLLLRLERGRDTKKSRIIIVAEGDESGGVYNLSKRIQEKLPDTEIRVSVLGHIQRGGAPTCMERVNASRMGYAAVEALLHGKKNVMVGIVNKEVCYTPFEKAIKHIDELDPEMIRLLEILSS